MENIWSLVERRLKLVEHTIKEPRDSGQASELLACALWLPRLAQSWCRQSKTAASHAEAGNAK